MNQEIKLKLEQASRQMLKDEADNLGVNITKDESNFVTGIFKAGIQTILNAPIEWGLNTQNDIEDAKAWLNISKTIDDLKKRAEKAESQLTKYREALEGVMRLRQLIDYSGGEVSTEHSGEAQAINQMFLKIEEALKQEVNND